MSEFRWKNQRFSLFIRHFHKHTKLAIILMPTLYFHIFEVFFIIWIEDVGKCEIRCRLVKGLPFKVANFIGTNTF